MMITGNDDHEGSTPSVPRRDLRTAFRACCIPPRRRTGQGGWSYQPEDRTEPSASVSCPANSPPSYSSGYSTPRSTTSRYSLSSQSDRSVLIGKHFRAANGPEVLSWDGNKFKRDDASGATVIITGCDTAASGALVIPETIEGKPVTRIGDYVFRSCTSLTSITFMGNAPTLGASVFGFGHPAATVYVVAGATGFSDPFGGLPMSPRSYVVNANGISVTITDCNTAASGALVIPETIEGKPVTSIIGQSAFRDCSSLTSITIGNGVP